MASTFKTPGVYVEEITKFPPSVAQVETAIPAFIGYTENSQYRGEDLALKPVRISSLVEYEARFGGAPPVDVSSINLDSDNNVVVSTTNSKYYLYYSLQLFFNNGGGACYIVSVGNYNSSVTKAALESGLNKLEKADEPTLILFPDGIQLGKTSLYELYQLALAQCAKLMDRFLIADVHIQNPLDEELVSTDIQEFRDKIGMGNLSYGAAYYPYLKVNLGRNIRYRDIKNKVQKLGTTINWANYADAQDQQLVSDLNNSVTAVVELEIIIRNYLTSRSISSAEEGFLIAQNALMAEVDAVTGNIPNIKARYKALLEFIYDYAYTFLQQAANSTNISGAVKSLITAKIGDLIPDVTQLIKIDNASGAATNDTGSYPIYDDNTRVWTTGGYWGTIFGSVTPGFSFTYSPVTTNSAADLPKYKQNIADAKPFIKDIFYKIFSAVTQIYTDAHQIEKDKETSALLRIPVLQNVINRLKTDLFIMPPSSGVAGIYASVDNSRGVWKAPANTSLNSVTAPSVTITHADQEGLNVDVNAGKSINAIRAFSGKGILVWGARTLAGNDNEWRYISVRRFYNMVEESVRKSTERFVFEPNDANTWVRVRAMIENFLTLQWRAGALAGAKPEDAFYVRVGLNQTMTALDILEGRMIVEIGMAVVRPAEFIILRFSHKMQES